MLGPPSEGILRLTRRPPKNVTLQHKNLFEREYAAEFSDFQTATARHLRVDALAQIVSPESVRSSLPRRQRASRAARVRAEFGYVPKVVPESVILTDSWSGNYFHWFGDVLQRLEFLAANDALPESPLLLPIHAQNAFARESLERYGVVPYVLQRHRLYHTERALFVHGGPSSGNYSPDLMARIRTRFVDNAPSNRSRSLYISRRLASRRVVNEADLTKALAPLGYETVLLEGRSLREQVELFSTARRVIAPHGAGLANMLWMSPGARVLEIRLADDSHNNCYFTLASALGIDYFYSLAKGSRWSRPSARPNLIADIDSLVSIADAMA